MANSIYHITDPRDRLVSLKHLGVTRSNTLPISTSEPEIHDAFSDTATLGPVELEEDAGAGKDHGEILNSLRVRTWLGNLDADKHDQEYVRLRDKLSDAAKWGYWDDVFDILESGHRIYEESWINAPRISELPMWNHPSSLSARGPEDCDTGANQR
jgi:hypothetical protein